jgi:dihydrofolate reductase
MQVNSIGIIDQDYCGDEDTIKFAYMNMRKEEVRINKGESFASIEESLDSLHSEGVQEVFVIGGAMIYNQFFEK